MKVKIQNSRNPSDEVDQWIKSRPRSHREAVF